jgi:hypothetical protein
MLKEVVEEIAEHPQAGCPSEEDRVTARGANTRRARRAQEQLLARTHQEARLMHINAYDHLVSMSRLLGTDGAMSLYSHTSLSRVACEAAVRLAWLLDSSVTYEERLARGSAVLLAGAEDRLKGAQAIPVGSLPALIGQGMIHDRQDERDEVCDLIKSAGQNLGLDRTKRKVARIEVPAAGVKVPMKLGIAPLMETYLPDSPNWYGLSSAVTHSTPWALHSAVTPGQVGHLQLTPDLLEVGAAAQSAISASALIVKTCASYYGHDARSWVRKSSQRRSMLDTLMREHWRAS